MKTFFRLAVVAVTLVSFFSFRPGDGEWVTYQEKKKARFEIQFPEKPDADKKGTNWFISATLDEPLTNFYVSVDFNTQNYTEETFRTRVQSNIDVVEQIFTTKVAEKTEMQFNGCLCIEYQYDMFGMKSVVRAFAKDNKLYELTVNPIVGEMPVMQRDKYFNSFRFLPPKK